MTRKKGWVIYLNDEVTARQRVEFKTEKRKVLEFVVQLEILHEGTWKPVLRYDGAHGFAHCDKYNLQGERRKDPLSLDFRDALTYAIADIKARWAEYLERFLRGEHP